MAVAWKTVRVSEDRIGGSIQANRNAHGPIYLQIQQHAEEAPTAEEHRWEKIGIRVARPRNCRAFQVQARVPDLLPAALKRSMPPKMLASLMADCLLGTENSSEWKLEWKLEAYSGENPIDGYRADFTLQSGPLRFPLSVMIDSPCAEECFEQTLARAHANRGHLESSIATHNNLQRRVDVLEKELERFADEREEVESKLLAAFSVVLNEKKRRIAELAKRPAETVNIPKVERSAPSQSYEGELSQTSGVSMQNEHSEAKRGSRVQFQKQESAENETTGGGESWYDEFLNDAGSTDRKYHLGGVVAQSQQFVQSKDLLRGLTGAGNPRKCEEISMSRFENLTQHNIAQTGRGVSYSRKYESSANQRFDAKRRRVKLKNQDNCSSDTNHSVAVGSDSGIQNSDIKERLEEIPRRRRRRRRPKNT